MNGFQKHTISRDKTIRDALLSLNKLSQSGQSVPLNLFVVDNNGVMLGSLTDGDIRRGLLSGKSLEDNLNKIMNSEYHFLIYGECSLEKIREFRKEEIGLVPILDDKKRIKDILDLTQKKSLLPIDSVLMAGGEGKRLRPLTNDTPKPLLKVGQKPIIEYIIDRINQYGIPNLTISTGYQAKKILDHFAKECSKWDMNINIIEEEEPLGTIGALSMIDHFEHDTILLSNADILSTINYENFYEFFIETKADVAVASVPYNVKVPYGIFKINGSDILSIQEKPEYTYYSNAGIYLLKKDLISEIPKQKYVDVTDFLKMLIDSDYKITYFPLLGYWQDIGRHEDFEKVQKDINLIEV